MHSALRVLLRILLLIGRLRILLGILLLGILLLRIGLLIGRRRLCGYGLIV